LLVLFGHARGLLLEGIGNVERPNIGTQAIYFLSSLQHEGVVLFFVVSGFLVGGSAWRMIASGRFGYPPYLINRFARIYLVYIPALMLVLVLDQIGKHFFIDTRFYGVRPLFPVAVFDEWTWAQIPCHLATLQGILCTPWGADPPLWSLGYEWAFYLIAPLILFPVLLRKRRGASDVIVPVALAVGLTWWNAEWLFWFAIWMCGAIAARIFEKGLVSVPIGLMGAVVCALALVLSRLKLGPQFATDAMVTIGLVVAISSRGLMRLGGEIAVVRRGAGFSYSLYLIHLPLCLLIGAIYQKWLGWPSGLVQPDARGIAGFAGMIVIALLVAFVFGRLTEDHTSTVRRWLTRRLLTPAA
jgi:peptidoglycan/LPS O-acetylase OafA/YrhL